jgi:type IV pilus assembly protein PilM
MAFSLRSLSSRRRIGVDIGATAVRAAQLRLDPPTLVRVAQVRLPEGAVQGGEVRDGNAVAAALTELWQLGRFKSRQVHLGIGNQRVVVREVTLPWLPDKELRESLPFQVQEYVPIPIDEAVLDYHVLEELEQDGRRMVRLLLVAAARSMILALVEAVDVAKLVPVGIDVVPFAIVRSVGDVDGMGLSEEIGDEAIVNIGADVTSIVVHTRGSPRFVRMLPSGGQDMSGAIATALPVSPEDAERLKRGETVGSEEVRTQAAAIVGSRTNAFIDEVRSSLDFYTAQSPGSRIIRVVLTGGGSLLSGLQEEMASQMKCEVVHGSPFGRVAPASDLVPEAMQSAAPLLSVAVGLAIPGDAA